jgi:hypothetical protein
VRFCSCCAFFFVYRYLFIFFLPYDLSYLRSGVYKNTCQHVYMTSRKDEHLKYQFCYLQILVTHSVLVENRQVLWCPL